ncbi:MAG: hypothetical protein ACRC0G_09270, partial [Fusobacteriaceae bacterium]
MEIDEIIEKLIETKILDMENIGSIRVGKLKSLISSKYDCEYSLKDINSVLNKNKDLIEISNNFFILKSELENILKDISIEDYKTTLESIFIIEIEDKYLTNIDVNSKGKSYEEIKKYGLE